MHAMIVPIGNSRGIRIPKSVLQQCRFTGMVDLEVKGETLIVRTVKAKPRQGWAGKFKAMHDIGEDQPLFQDTMDLDIRNWQW